MKSFTIVMWILISIYYTYMSHGKPFINVISEREFIVWIWMGSIALVEWGINKLVKAIKEAK